MIAEGLLVTKLLTLFTIDQIAPAGDNVYHASGDPVSPFVLYRRTGTETDRGLDGSAQCQVLTFEVSIDSMFFSQLNQSMPDDWTDTSTGSKWYFALENQDQDTSNFRINFTYSAAGTPTITMGGQFSDAQA